MFGVCFLINRLVLWRDIAEKRAQTAAEAISGEEIQRTEVERLTEHLIQVTVSNLFYSKKHL